MKINNKEEFNRQNAFEQGQENTAFAQYFIGNSYLNPPYKSEGNVSVSGKCYL